MKKIIDIQSNCILCHSCFSSCPVYEVNPDFLGPFALTRAFRYINDKKESDVKEHIDSIQTNGVWDCTLYVGTVVWYVLHILILKMTL